MPDFVIIGAQKSGTTSLYDYITSHPSVARARYKEVHYFSLRHKYGKLWYRSNFQTNFSRRRFYEKTGQKLLSGEASPYYLFHPAVPDRMKAVLPDVKLIVILRNPVDRAYSHYHHTSRKNQEPLSFEEAIRAEEARCTGERERLLRDPDFVPLHYRNHSYLSRGVYADQLENWFKYYGREQFLILATEDLRKDPQRTLDRVFDFLGATPLRVGGLRDRNVGDYKEMGKETRKFLIEYFRPYNQRLYKMLHRSFDWN